MKENRICYEKPSFRKKRMLEEWVVVKIQLEGEGWGKRRGRGRRGRGGEGGKEGGRGEMSQKCWCICAVHWCGV